MDKDLLLLCTLADLPDGGARGFDPLRTGQDSMLVVRQGQRLYAYRDLCPHYGDTPMAWRRHAYLNADATLLVCAAHGAQFDIRSGACVRGACLGQSLTPVEVHLEDGMVYLLPAAIPAPPPHAAGPAARHATSPFPSTCATACASPAAESPPAAPRCAAGNS